MKIRNFMSGWEWTILAVIVIAISLKIYADKACIDTGCYGPFEIVLEAENGERVEDVIVKLYRVSGGGAFGSAKVTYSEWALGNTGEVILLPRGYVGKSQSPNLKMGYSIIHPDYTASRELPYVRFPNQQGVIDLGKKIIVRNKYIHDLDLARRVDAAREAGRSEETPRGQTLSSSRTDTFKPAGLSGTDALEFSRSLRLQNEGGFSPKRVMFAAVTVC